MNFTLLHILLLLTTGALASSPHTAPGGSIYTTSSPITDATTIATTVPVAPAVPVRQRTELQQSSGPAPMQYNNELPDQLQWDTIDKLQRDRVLEFMQKTLLEVVHANDYSSQGSTQISTAKLVALSSNTEVPITSIAARLTAADLVVRNLTYFMALIYMDRLAIQVQEFTHIRQNIFI